ncbi:PTS mannose/fructose/sorbose/N-acetylgalactosamine transporter subunit IIC [Eubacterium ramulus]|uniref:PTS mannose/fructose/sorbose/N-acetylgalactosamine transporter subunit IIC n=1 Tax=uncultured Eubacterium sp. TaxID=165185 RepID=UPI00259913F9|nr:PTS sugar transporter subunit IIC [uncultured Eubacterium sp.]
MIWLQNILIVLLAGYMSIDQNGPVVLSWFSAIVGMISGLIMGDVSTGLMIGGTFQLMSLGVAALGGASAPNYGLATIIGTFIAVRTGTGIDAAIAVGLPVGLLAIQLEVVARIILNFVAHKMQSDNNEGKWGRMNRIALLGPAICSLQTLIPTVIVVAFGASVVNLILKVIPEWVTNGLSIAAGMLPVVGIAMLMRYMPVKKFLPFILIGFVLSAYLNVPVLGIAIVGFAAAFGYFKIQLEKAETAAAVPAAGTVDEMGDDFDE